MSKTKIITKEIVGNTYTQKVIFRVLIGSLVFLSIFYVYMIGSITFNVVARKSLENTAVILGSNISQLELNYLNNMNEINKSRALSLGYIETHSNIFATRSITHVAIR